MEPIPNPSPSLPKTRLDYLAGLGGAAAVLGSAFGLSFSPWGLEQKTWSALGLTGLVMVLLTVWINRRTGEPAPPTSERPSPNLRGVLGAALGEYLSLLCLSLLAFWLYRQIPEYGFAQGAAFYARFFEGLTGLFWAVGLAGLPYLLVTFLWVPGAAEALGYRHLPGQLWAWAGWRLPVFADRLRKPEAAQPQGQVQTLVLGLVVKAFFVPVMLAFFQDQFSVLQNNLKFLQACWAGEAHLGWADLFHLPVNLIFTLDVALATCGYLFSFRWLHNQIRSVEPTLLGWVVTLLCYPPFRVLAGFYLVVPSEQSFFALESPVLRFFFGATAVLSYLIYLSATLAFGLRFSNLTHRGILWTGPYRWVRHPAYGAKNLAWILVMAPTAVVQGMTTGSSAALFSLLGIAGMSGLYYLRAITEERHLGADPEYREYCRKVRYRFFPGLW